MSYRILAVAATPFFVDRGGHIHIYEPIKALQALGHHVTLVTYHIGRDLPNLDTRRIPYIPWYQKTDAGPSYFKPFLAILMLWKTLWVAREIKPDVLHAHGWDSMWVAWWVWRLMGIPFIFDMQGSFAGEISEHGFAKKGSPYFHFLEFIEGLSLRASPIIVTSSSQIYEDTQTRFNITPPQISTILDGVDTETFSPQNFPPRPELRAELKLPDKPIAIFMGLLKTYQGVDDLVEAVRIMVQERQFTDFHCLVLGFPDEDHYRAMAEQKGIGDYLTFTGKIPYDETGHYLALADVAIAPKISMTEGDAKIYFYMSMGLPVVAYERPASREILGELGLYAAYNNPTDLARALAETLSQPDLMQTRGADNRAKAVQNYSWGAVAYRIQEAYQHAMQKMAQPAHTPSRIKQLWHILRLLLGAIGILILLQVVDIQDVSKAITSANPAFLLMAWVLNLASMGFKTARWQILLQENHLEMSFRRLFGTYLIGTFYSQFLPGSSAGGDAMRMAESSVDTGRAVDAVASVIIERGIGLTTIVTTSSLILLLDRPVGIPAPVHILIHSLSILGIGGLILLRFGWFLGAIIQILSRIGLRQIGAKVKHLSQALQGDLGEGRILLSMIVLSLLANLCGTAASYLVLTSISEPVPFLGFFSLITLIVTLEIIPLTPGSLGIREGAYVFFLGFLGISQAHALTSSILIRLLGWLMAMLGGGILLQRAIFSTVSPTAPATSGGD